MEKTIGFIGCGNMGAALARAVRKTVDGAVACGVPREKAQLYAEKTILGTARYLIESGMHPAVLKDAVCSPGGTTIAGVEALENAGFRAATASAVTTAFEKTKKIIS